MGAAAELSVPIEDAVESSIRELTLFAHCLARKQGPGILDGLSDIHREAAWRNGGGSIPFRHTTGRCCSTASSPRAKTPIVVCAIC